MKNKVFIIVFIIIILAIIGVLAFFQFINYRDSQISLIQDNVIIEYGETYNPIIDNLIDIEKFSFIDKDRVEINSNITNEENKDYPAVGEYEINLLYKKVNLIQKVEVKDRISPNLTVDENIEIQAGTDLENYDFSNYIKISDLSEVEKYNIDFSNVNRDVAGEYDTKVSVKDIYGNIEEKNVKISIIKKEAPISNIEDNKVLSETQSKSTLQNSSNKKKTNTKETKVNTNENKTNTNNSQNQQSTLSQSNLPTQSVPSSPEPNVSQPIAPSNPTPSDLSYWCADGGSHHVLGDGPNECGYFSSWDEANQAFLNFTSNWQSVQYKIDQCACGLYYFWAIQ